MSHFEYLLPVENQLIFTIDLVVGWLLPLTYVDVKGAF